MASPEKRMRSDETSECDTNMATPEKRMRFEESSALNDAVNNGHWKTVGEVLKTGAVPDHQLTWAVDMASQAADDTEFRDHILPHCSDEQTTAVLTTLVSRSMWISLGQVLNRGTVPDHILTRAVKTDADKRNIRIDDFTLPTKDQQNFAIHVLPHCSDDQLITVLTTIITQRRWEYLDAINARQRILVSETMCKYINNKVHLDYNSIIMTMVANKRWLALAQLFGYVSKSQDTPREIRFILKHLVNFSMWGAASLILRTEAVGVTVLKHVIIKACEKATETDLLTHIVQHFSCCIMLDSAANNTNSCQNMKMNNTNLPVEFTIVKILTSRDLWKIVCYVLDTGVSLGMRLWAIEEVYDIKERCFSTTVCIRLHRAEKSFNLLEIKNILDETCWNQSLKTTIMCLMHEKRKDQICGNHQSYHKNVILPAQNTLVKFVKLFKRLYTANTIEDGKYLFKSQAYCCYTLYTVISFIGLMQTDKQYLYYNEWIVTVFSLIPIFPDMQSVSLRVLLNSKKWNDISHADLTHVWEEVRRELFKTAVQQGQWTVVKKWADHSLYHDQRCWAMHEAKKHDQWDVYLLLSDHGLTKKEQMHNCFHLAQKGDWSTIVEMLNFGFEIAEIQKFVKMAKIRKFQISRHAEKKNKRRAKMFTCVKHLYQIFGKNTCIQIYLKTKYVLCANSQMNSFTNTINYFNVATEKHNFWVVKYLLRNKIKLNHSSSVLHVAELNTLFHQMVKLKQWDICLELLEKGVDANVCLSVLPTLLQFSQWKLVATIMEYDVGDSIRRDVMQTALERREGSIVWHCISTLKEGLSHEERQNIFQASLSRGVWQAVKPLIEIKDSLGFEHRDQALKQAVEERRWDMVDYCQRCNADINMHKEYDDNPLQTAAINEDWEAVKELVQRGGDQSQLDSQGLSVLHRAIKAQQWETVKMLIQYNGNLCLENSYSFTPLQKLMLMDKQALEMISDALYWSPINVDCTREENNKESLLHAVCRAGCPHLMYYLVARGANPLAVTEEGESVVMFSVMCKTNPVQILAECIRLGFSTHQPFINEQWWNPRTLKLRLCGHEAFTSPLEYALIHNMPTICFMLYESGACSNKEVFILYELLQQQHLLQQPQFSYSDSEDNNDSTIEKTQSQMLEYLEKVATTPRTLKSMCRLVVSKAFNVRGKRHKEVNQLYVLTPDMIDYILFTDLTDPAFCEPAVLLAASRD